MTISFCATTLVIPSFVTVFMTLKSDEKKRKKKGTDVMDV